MLYITCNTDVQRMWQAVNVGVGLPFICHMKFPNFTVLQVGPQDTQFIYLELGAFCYCFCYILSLTVYIRRVEALRIHMFSSILKINLIQTSLDSQL